MDGADKEKTSRSRSTPNKLSSSIRSSLSWTTRRMEDVFGGGSRQSRNSSRAAEDEEALRWPAIERLPTYERLRTSIIKSFLEGDNKGGHGNDKLAPREVDVRKLGIDDRQKFINALFKVAEEDNEKFLKRFKNRIGN
ncbi:hypothetical protein DITRI_Ditri02bG0087700 [Diplodiscus trichospermus]